jgi:outer membrane translocation and assembly module TamA
MTDPSTEKILNILRQAVAEGNQVTIQDITRQFQGLTKTLEAISARLSQLESPASKPAGTKRPKAAEATTEAAAAAGGAEAAAPVSEKKQNILTRFRNQYKTNAAFRAEVCAMDAVKGKFAENEDSLKEMKEGVRLNKEANLAYEACKEDKKFMQRLRDEIEKESGGGAKKGSQDKKEPATPPSDD